MKDSDMRHLRRADLLALLEDLSRENDRLRAELVDTKAKLEAKEARLSECGSLAEAALQLSGVYEAADRAAETYLALVKQNYPETAVSSREKSKDNEGFEDASVLSSVGTASGVLDPQKPSAPSGNVYAAGGPVGRRQNKTTTASDEDGEA